MSGLRRGRSKRGGQFHPHPRLLGAMRWIKINAGGRAVFLLCEKILHVRLRARILIRDGRTVCVHLFGVGYGNICDCSQRRTIAGLLAGTGRIGEPRTGRRFARRRIPGIRLIPRGIVSTACKQKHHGQKWNDFFRGFCSFHSNDIIRRRFTVLLPGASSPHAGLGTALPVMTHCHAYQHCFRYAVIFKTSTCLPWGKFHAFRENRVKWRISMVGFTLGRSAGGTFEAINGVNPANQCCHGSGLFHSSRPGFNPNWRIFSRTFIRLTPSQRAILDWLPCASCMACLKSSGSKSAIMRE